MREEGWRGRAAGTGQAKRADRAEAGIPKADPRVQAALWVPALKDPSQGGFDRPNPFPIRPLRPSMRKGVLHVAASKPHLSAHQGPESQKNQNSWSTESSVFCPPEPLESHSCHLPMFPLFLMPGFPSVWVCRTGQGRERPPRWLIDASTPVTNPVSLGISAVKVGVLSSATRPR